MQNNATLLAAGMFRQDVFGTQDLSLFCIHIMQLPWNLLAKESVFCGIAD